MENVQKKNMPYLEKHAQITASEVGFNSGKCGSSFVQEDMSLVTALFQAEGTLRKQAIILFNVVILVREH